MPRLRLILAAILLLLALAAATAYGVLRASLPQLEGERVLPGLWAPVTVARDARGVPDLHAERPEDLARALGFLHAQDRFFQMDLQRRAPVGELAELLGEAALPADRHLRLHRIRQVASQVLAGLDAAERRLLQAYADGVNDGLAALAAPPFEYLLLRSSPRPWQPIDTVLTLYALYFDLHDETARRESRLGVLRDTVPPQLSAFLSAAGSEWDAPLDGSRVRLAEIPGPEVVNLREGASATGEERAIAAGEPRYSDDAAIGSNNWALAGRHVAGGGALLADDMHLGLGVPAIWYQARLSWRDADGSRHAAVGATLPGTPALVVGSNGYIAWGFTNLDGDWADLIELELDPDDPQRYLTPDGYLRFETIEETIAVRGGEPQRLRLRTTVWGPVVDEDHRGRPRALRWLAHLPEATNLRLLEMVRARSVDEALALAPTVGVPPQNLLLAGRDGRIAWTPIGRLPLREGYDSRYPASWARAGVGWRGLRAAEDYPRIADPAEGRLWTANNRTVGGEALAALGDGGYALGARARQIRDDLRALQRPATPGDMLAVQLDDRAVFLARWRDLLLTLLDEPALADDPRRRQLRAAVQHWGARAAVDSVGYRLVRGFRLQTMALVFEPLTAPARAADPRFRFEGFNQAEGALWQLLSERPEHLLDPRYPSWRALLLDAADRVLDALWQQDTGLAAATWGAFNTARIRHPLSAALPGLSRWLDMPAVPLPGDAHMPRVQAPAFGASQRLAVVPGREEEGIFELPGGPSAHPLSPFYRSGFAAWAAGESAALLPGPPRYRLTLRGIVGDSRRLSR